MFHHRTAIFCICIYVIQYCEGNLVDLSHDVSEDAHHWLEGVPFTRTVLAKGYSPKGFWYEANSFCMSEHTSTHLDAPSHFAEGKWRVHEIPIEHLIGPGVVIDITSKVAKNHTAELSTDDLMSWLNEHGPLPDGVIVLVYTGWDKRYGNKKDYFGTDTNDTSNLVYPGVSPGAAQILASYEAANGNKVVGVGLDSPSLDHGPSKLYEAHQAIFKANIYALENVANLGKLPTKGFQVSVMPMKIRGGSGAPARVVATLPDASRASAGITSVVSLLLLSTFLHLFREL
ncbi:hypothetical protein SK128_018325 [Halocaridina rubra]|uniref:Kynurenine formamidase n=1 Tax=Halocaridina rubra TaxID=373956 RepID=A0AAN9ACW2_HALRR